MKPKTKRQRRVTDKTSVYLGEDRISELPDAVLCHILSFIDTLYAVRTCVLSRRWKNIWESVSTLNFNCGPFRYASKLKTFVDHVLFLRNSSNIQKLHLYWKHNRLDLSHIDGWIRTAMKRNVTELDLRVEITYGHDHFYELPRGLFMCKTLVVLKLTKHYIANVPTSGCFPSLKILHVSYEDFCDDSMFKIFSNCPVLEDLTIDGYSLGPRVSVLKVAAPALRTLRICNDKMYQQYNHSIDCPKLENLVLKGKVSNKYCLGKVEFLVNASIELLNHCSNKDPFFSRVPSLLARVSGVKVLCLSAHCFQVGYLPAFGNLSELKLVLHKCFFWEYLMELLNKSPHLQYLVLEHSATSCDIKYSEQESDSEPEERSEPRWHAPKLVPSCLVSNLETISIEGFKGQLNTIEMAKYFLGNSEVLNKMTIYSDPLCVEKQALHAELLKVPKVSKACVVNFV